MEAMRDHIVKKSRVVSLNNYMTGTDTGDARVYSPQMKYK